MTAEIGQSELPDELHVLVPFWGLAGGVIKVLDYANHAWRSGVSRVTIWAPPLPSHDDPVMSLPVLQSLQKTQTVQIADLESLSLRDQAEPWVLFTEPGHMRLIEEATDAHLGSRLIHLIQGTRHADPKWNDGLNYRLLHRPMTRIAVTAQVALAIRPHTNSSYPLETILEGHDCAYFSASAPERSADAPLRVLYTTWKSTLGDRVAEALADLDSIVFTAVRGPASWPELRSLYHDADVFLCTPGPNEGFYLPGLEAMAAECVVVSAFVGGNESYLVENENMLRASYDDVADHVQALRTIAVDPGVRRRLVESGTATTARHTLERERSEFAAMLAALARPTSSQKLP